MNLSIISAQQLQTLLHNPEILIIDLRSRQAYQQEHIPGAINADYEIIDMELLHLLGDTINLPEKIILYCDYGNASLAAARDLSKLGFPVVSLGGGYQAWKKVKNQNIF